MNDDRIVIFKSKVGDCWMARFEGPQAAEIVSAFDTNEIPTPFTLRMPAEKVQQELQSRNPSIKVLVEFKEETCKQSLG